jgi:hypothetical protein
MIVFLIRKRNTKKKNSSLTVDSADYVGIMKKTTRGTISRVTEPQVEQVG